MQLFDAHCHLQDQRLSGEASGRSLDAVLSEAAEAGVHQLACNGCWQEDWGAVAAAAAAHPGSVVANFGLHPWWVGRRSSEWLQQLRQMLEQHPHAGLGEVGAWVAWERPDVGCWPLELWGRECLPWLPANLITHRKSSVACSAVLLPTVLCQLEHPGCKTATAVWAGQGAPSAASGVAGAVGRV